MKARNRHACAPIMRKGGPHEASQGAKRAKAKQALNKTLKHIEATKGRLDDFYEEFIAVSSALIRRPTSAIVL